MAQTTSDNIRTFAPKPLDDKWGIFEPLPVGWRPFNDIAEFNSTFPLVNRFNTMTFWIKSTVDADKADLYTLDKNKNPYKVQADVDLSNYYTKAQIDALNLTITNQVDELNEDLIQEIENRQSGDETNADAIEATNAIVATKANAADITDDIVIAFGNPNLVGSTYTDVSLANKTLQVTYTDENGTHAPWVVFNSLGAGTLPAIPVSGNIQTNLSIRGNTGVLANYVKNSDFIPVKELTENLPLANIVSNIQEEPVSPWSDNIATEFPNSGYINNLGNVVASATFVHTNLSTIPVGATKVKLSFATFYSIAFYNSSSVFISTLGQSDSFDVELTIPVGAVYYKYNMLLKYLPNGSEYALHPSYLYVDIPVFKYSIEDLQVNPLNIKETNNVEEIDLDKTNDFVSADFVNVGYIQTNGTVNPLASYKHTNKKTLTVGRNILKVSFAAIFGVAFYDEDDVFIAVLGSGDAGGITDTTINIPEGASSVVYMLPITYLIGGANYAAFPPYLYQGISSVKNSIEWLRLNPINLQNQWLGKTILAVGTSIPHGFPKQSNPSVWSYINRTAANLGAIAINNCVDGGVIRATKADGSSMGSTINALSLTRLTSAVNYQNAILDLIGTENEPDLLIMNYGVNDESVDASDINAYASFDYTNENTNTFLGSINFVIKQVLTAKPSMRIVLLTHFSNDSFNIKDRYSNLNKAIEMMGAYWGIPTLSVQQKTGWIYRNGINTVLSNNRDGIHPASTQSNEPVTQLTNILTEFLKSI